MLQVAVGHSCDPDSQSAIEEVLEQCAGELAGKLPKAGILLAAIEFDHGLILQHIQQIFPGIELIGCTTDGEISSVAGFQEDSLTLILFSSDAIEIRAGVGYGLAQDAIAAANQAVAQASAQITQAPKLCIVLPESLTGRAVDLLLGLKQNLGLQVPVVGGLTADHYQFKKTYQFFQTQILSDAAPILLFAGELLLSCGVANGSHPVGAKGIVTKVNKNIVYEIDHRPAYEFYHRYLGDLTVQPDIGFVMFDETEQHSSLRMPSKEPGLTAGELSFYGYIPEGAIVQIAQTDRDDVLNSAKLSMQQALATYPGKEPAAALFFSCAIRRRLLGPYIRKEYEVVQDQMLSDRKLTDRRSTSLPSCGFYTYGEISPFELPGESQFHNQTFVTVLLGTA